MWTLRWWKSIQKHRPPSFFWTNTTALHHTLWLGQIMPESNISHRCAQTSSTNGGGICLKSSLNGVSLVTLITCSVEWVQPSLLGFREETLWYSAKRDWVEATSWVGQDSNPLRSNSSNNFSCLCFMVCFGAYRPWASSGASVQSVCTGNPSTHVTMTVLATGVFFLRVWGYAILFLTTTVTFLLSL